MFAGPSHDNRPGEIEPSRSPPRDQRRFMTCRWHAFQKLRWTEAESSVGQLLSVDFRLGIMTRLYQEELNLWVRLDGSKLFTMINFESK